jgi:hypothetical protein
MYRAKGRSNAARISNRPSWSIYHPSSPPTYEEDYLSNIQLFRTSIARTNLPCINNQRGRLEGYSEEESEAAVWGEMDVLMAPQHRLYCLAYLV